MDLQEPPQLTTIQNEFFLPENASIGYKIADIDAKDPERQNMSFSTTNDLILVTDKGSTKTRMEREIPHQWAQ